MLLWLVVTVIVIPFPAIVFSCLVIVAELLLSSFFRMNTVWLWLVGGCILVVTSLLLCLITVVAEMITEFVCFEPEICICK